MKFTLAWLKEHLETDATLDEITYALTDLGLEVEGVENPAEALAAFTTGHVVSAEKHPDADKLKVCQVETVEGVQQIICGAPNARAGIDVVIALPGTYVPGIDATIQVGKIRGVESFGMMCSEREMLLSDEHDGIIELDGKPAVGTKFVDYLAEHMPSKTDPVIEIAITPNRPDALGVHGVARDLAARGVGKLIEKSVAPIEGKGASPIGVSIDEDTLAQAPVFYGRVIKGVKNGSSPQWLQDRLKAIGLRPISALVDITNFFTFDQNRPLHVFDVDKVRGNLRVHNAKGGETLTALDEKEYTLDAGMTAISDDKGLESIAGVMGGLETGCTEETVNVFLEAAFFDPIRTAMTGRALKINSDARYRFERGIDPAYTPTGFHAATQMILDLCGGEASEVVIAGEVPNIERAYTFDPARVQSLVGMEIDPKEQEEILIALGFDVKGDQASPPSWRPDILGDADLVEEIVRVKSLTLLSGQPMHRKTPGIQRATLTERQVRIRNLRLILAHRGLNECVNYSFIDEKSAKLFGGGTDAVKIGNPISQDMSHMRPSLYAGLLHAAARNIARGYPDMGLFEVGMGFDGGEPDELFTAASGILIGANAARNAYDGQRGFDVFDAKSILGEALGAIGHSIEKLTLLDHDASWFHPTRAAKLGLGPKNIIAEFGELHPSVTKALGIKSRVVAFSIFVDKLPQRKKKTTTRSALVLNELQSISRDFAFVVDANTKVDDLLKAMKAADKNLITEAILFDVFEGKKAEEQLGDGKKSLAVSIEISPKKESLTDEEIQKISDAVIERAKKSVGAALRS